MGVFFMTAEVRKQTRSSSRGDTQPNEWDLWRNSVPIGEQNDDVRRKRLEYYSGWLVYDFQFTLPDIPSHIFTEYKCSFNQGFAFSILPLSSDVPQEKRHSRQWFQFPRSRRQSRHSLFERRKRFARSYHDRCRCSLESSLLHKTSSSYLV